jgi:hypothetical protein
MRRLARLLDGEEQTCIVCRGLIREAEEFGGVVVASKLDADGKGGTSQPVCDMCAVDPERAMDFASSGMTEAAVTARWLTGYDPL